MTLSKSQNAALAGELDTLARNVGDAIRDTLPQTADEKALDHAGVVYDIGDESAAKEQEDLRHALHERLLREQRQVESARIRLAEGNIDRCVDCDGEVGYDRLRANPVAMRCVECQWRFEAGRAKQEVLKV